MIPPTDPAAFLRSLTVDREAHVVYITCPDVATAEAMVTQIPPHGRRDGVLLGDARPRRAGGRVKAAREAAKGLLLLGILWAATKVYDPLRRWLRGK